MQEPCSRKSAISIIAERTLHLLIKARVASHTMRKKKAGFHHTSPWYLGNNTSSGWCGKYTPYEREFSPGTYWLHHVQLSCESAEAVSNYRCCTQLSLMIQSADVHISSSVRVIKHDYDPQLILLRASSWVSLISKHKIFWNCLQQQQKFLWLLGRE